MVVVSTNDSTVPVTVSSWLRTPDYKQYSTIVFLVPDGTYTYVVYPLNILGEFGTITVQGSDVSVQVQYHGAGGCTANISIWTRIVIPTDYSDIITTTTSVTITNIYLNVKISAEGVI